MAFNTMKIYHPLDLINQIILDKVHLPCTYIWGPSSNQLFKEPSCDIAVTHDDLWADILEEVCSTCFIWLFTNAFF